MIAKFVKKLDGFKGDARLYEVEGGEHPYVVVSASIVPYSGPETYIFSSDEEGRVTEWGELPGSFQGGLDHERALREGGYEIR